MAHCENMKNFVNNMTTIYTLELENDKYYVGRSNIPENRILNHFTKNGSEWTKKYKPIKVISQTIGDPFDEEKNTLIAMDNYGIDNVRGGSYCKIELSDFEKEKALQTIRSITDKCYTCGDKGHFAKGCKSQKKILQQNDRVKRENENYKNFVSKCKGDCEMCGNRRFYYRYNDGEDDIYVSCEFCYVGNNWAEDMFVKLIKN